MYGIFTYMYRKNQPNVGNQVNIPYMDPMGIIPGSGHCKKTLFWVIWVVWLSTFKRHENTHPARCLWFRLKNSETMSCFWSILIPWPDYTPKKTNSQSINSRMLKRIGSPWKEYGNFGCPCFFFTEYFFLVETPRFVGPWEKFPFWLSSFGWNLGVRFKLLIEKRDFILTFWSTRCFLIYPFFAYHFDSKTSLPLSPRRRWRRATFSRCSASLKRGRSWMDPGMKLKAARPSRSRRGYFSAK